MKSIPFVIEKTLQEGLSILVYLNVYVKMTEVLCSVYCGQYVKSINSCLLYIYVSLFLCIINQALKVSNTNLQTILTFLTDITTTFNTDILQFSQ